MRAGMVVVAVASATAFAPVAQAAMVEAAHLRGGQGVRSWFDAYSGERNQVRLEMSGDSDTYQDPGAVLLTPLHESELEPGSIPNVFDLTLDRCTYLGVSATCTRSPSVGPDVRLKDGDDAIDIQAAAGQPAAFVDGGPGADVARSTGPIFFTGGTGGDRLEPGPGRVFEYDEQPPVDMQIDLDGIADDGAPGEGDNVLPGVELRVFVAGNHTITGHAGADQLHSAAGNQTIHGLAGDDFLSGGGHDDVLHGGPGQDRLFGGIGDDTIHAQDGEVDEIYCDFGADVAYVDSQDVVLHPDDDIFGCETVIVG